MSSTTRTADSSNNNVSERPEKRQKTSAPIATLFAGRGSDTAATNTLPTLVTTTHTADPAGDLILQFPEQQQAICASSSVMKLCSPVFRAMLGPHFREGQGAADRPRMVPLPGDDAESMRVVCHALHHVDPAPTVTFDRLAGVARLVDKYDMVHALRPYIEAWLRKLMRGSEESEPSRIQMEHGADLLYATVLLDAPEAFMNWTRVLVLHHADSFLALKDEHDFVTSDILGPEV
ncbi:hypothetical protein SLS58_006634 [Diplodia intermedia]|uniref:BTB domain-containing protein n=1 Tax=Diplodia intermedia TaxID=856260 RepID=A0ABR3TMH0_9PEZI